MQTYHGYFLSSVIHPRRTWEKSLIATSGFADCMTDTTISRQGISTHSFSSHQQVFANLENHQQQSSVKNSLTESSLTRPAPARKLVISGQSYFLKLGRIQKLVWRATRVWSERLAKIKTQTNKKLKKLTSRLHWCKSLPDTRSPSTETVCRCHSVREFRGEVRFASTQLSSSSRS